LKFTDLHLDPDLEDGILSLGFEEATPIQEQAIPVILEGKDLIACAQTGTGKTAAYLIPTLERLTTGDHDSTRVLILAPTRELAKQIDQNVEALSYFTGTSSFAVIGGKDASGFDRQRFALTNGSDILIATPGRLIMHMALGFADFSKVEVLILDEADKMLDMGFYADILKIVGYLPKKRQTLMFSATMPEKIRKLAVDIMKDPEEISLNLAKPAEGINQMAFMVYPEQKIPLLEHLIREREVENMIIFASSKANVDEITRRLQRLNYQVKAMHSDKTQQEREQTLREFKNGEFNIIVGTDVLARGIDIDNLSHVLNYDVPLDAEDYVHRVGRTARAKKTGEAITFISPRDQHKFVQIENLIEATVPKPEVPKELGKAPVYDPKRRSRDGRDGRDNRGGSKRRYKGGNKRRGPRKEGDGRKQRSHGGPENREGGDKPRKSRNKRRNYRKGRSGGEGGSSTPPPAKE